MTSAALAPDASRHRRPAYARRLAPTAYLTAAISIAVIAVMAAPHRSLVARLDQDARPTRRPRRRTICRSALSFENYAKVIRLPGGPRDLCRQFRLSSR